MSLSNLHDVFLQIMQLKDIKTKIPAYNKLLILAKNLLLHIFNLKI